MHRYAAAKSPFSLTDEDEYGTRALSWNDGVGILDYSVDDRSDDYGTDGLMGAHIHNIAVDKGERGKGYGTQMLSDFEAYLSENHPEVEFASLEAHPSLLGFYEGAGYYPEDDPDIIAEAPHEYHYFSKWFDKSAMNQRTAWDNPRPARTWEESVERFGEEFSDAVALWGWDTEGPSDTLAKYHDQYKEPTPFSGLYRGVSHMDLNVGDTYSSTGLDSWTPSLDIAEEFSGVLSNFNNPTVLELDEPTEGLNIGKVWSPEFQHEGEWLLGGDFEVTETYTSKLDGMPYKTVKLRRKAWDNPTPAKDWDEAEARFGDEFVDSVYAWKEEYSPGDEPFGYSDKGDYSERHRPSPPLYRGVMLNEPLKVGDIYETQGTYDSWTEDSNLAARFAVPRLDNGTHDGDHILDDFPRPEHGAILHLPDGADGLPIDRLITTDYHEGEWLVGGQFEVTEASDERAAGMPYKHIKLRRKAWDNLEPARSRDESVERFGEEFVKAVDRWKDGDTEGPNDTLTKYHDQHKEPAPPLYRGVADDLNVGDTYRSRGLDGWTPSFDIADNFSDGATVLHLDEGEEGLFIDRVHTNYDYQAEQEWLLGGDFEVVEELEPSGHPVVPVRNLRLRRRAMPFTVDEPGRSLNWEGLDGGTGWIDYELRGEGNVFVDYVKATPTGMGYGKELMTEFEDYLRTNNPEVKTISLDHLPSLNNFYDELGYEFDNEEWMNRTGIEDEYRDVDYSDAQYSYTDEDGLYIPRRKNIYGGGL